MKNGAKIEVHILQNFPPHNLNRDDTGAPKDTEFGMERRGRISSQCLKRSIRWSSAFVNELDGRIANRTKYAAERVATALIERHNRDAAESTLVGRAAISKLVSKVDDNGKTSVLFYVGPDEIEDLADALNDHWEEIAPAFAEAAAASTSASDSQEDSGKPRKKGGKKEKKADSSLETAVGPFVESYLKEYDGRVGSADIALFGRMLAEQPGLNMDAACHVAHAISTNRTTMEFDYFTAVDDLQPNEETGASMIGTTMFNSSCFYRYAVIDTRQLLDNLSNGDGSSDLARSAIRGFIRGSIEAIPSGKQASTAAYTPPSLVMTVVRPAGSMPISLANAFESPARPTRESGLVAESVRKLDMHWKDLVDMYGASDVVPFVVVQDSVNTLEHLKNHCCSGVDELLDRTVEAIDGAFAEGA